MKFTLNEPIEEKKYDLLFTAIQILEKIQINKYIGDNLTISDFEIDKFEYSFTIDDGYKPIDVNIAFQYAGKIIEVVLFMPNDNVIKYELDHDYQNILSNSIVSNKGDRTVTKKMFYKDKYAIYNYELEDDVEHIWFSFTAPKDENNYKIYDYLLNKGFDFNELTKLLKEYNIVKKCLLIITINNEVTFYELNDNSFKILKSLPYIEDPILTKVYKYN